MIVAGIYAPIISQDIEFNALGVSDISAPNGEDKENEFDFDEKIINRKIGQQKRYINTRIGEELLKGLEISISDFDSEDKIKKFVSEIEVRYDLL